MFKPCNIDVHTLITKQQACLTCAQRLGDVAGALGNMGRQNVSPGANAAYAFNVL